MGYMVAGGGGSKVVEAIWYARWVPLCAKCNASGA